MASFDEFWTGLRQAGGAAPYMLVDCAGIEAGAAALPREAFAELECLFTGELATELADVAPWLGRLASWDETASNVAQDLLRRHVGTLVLLAPGQGEAVSFAAMHRHFRKLNVVYDPAGKPLFFRYYDPRLVADVLSVMDAVQLDAFFGPVESLVVADAGGRPVRCFRQSGKLAVHS